MSVYVGATTVNHAYRELLGALLDRGVWEVNKRTATKVLVLPGGYNLRLDLRRGLLPVPGNRRYRPRVAAAETAWQFMGTKDPTFIMAKAPKLWGKFVEHGEIKTAYGYRWRHHFGRDQVAMAIEALSTDKTNRQVYISAWDPATDGLGVPGQPKNLPCPVGFHLYALDGHLHMTVLLRSSDVFVGLPYDVMSYALTLDALAVSTDMAPGTLQMTLAHAHLYETHWAAAKETLTLNAAREWLDLTEVEPFLPAFSVRDIVADPDTYVLRVERLSGRKKMHPWDPRPEVVE